MEGSEANQRLPNFDKGSSKYISRDIDPTTTSIDICTKIKDEDLVFGSTPAFARVVEGCIHHVGALVTLVARLIPIKGDSAMVKIRKAVASARLEKK